MGLGRDGCQLTSQHCFQVNLGLPMQVLNTRRAAGGQEHILLLVPGRLIVDCPPVLVIQVRDSWKQKGDWSTQLDHHSAGGSPSAHLCQLSNLSHSALIYHQAIVVTRIKSSIVTCTGILEIHYLPTVPVPTNLPASLISLLADTK